MKSHKVKKLVKKGVKPYKLNRSLQKLGFKLYDHKKKKKSSKSKAK